jgi:hypothetical protein
MLERVVRGEATPMELDIITSVQQNIIGHCLCVLGDSMAMPVSAMVAKFRDEFEQVIAEAALARIPTTNGDHGGNGGNGINGGTGTPDLNLTDLLERERLQGRPIPVSEQESPDAG